MSSSVEPIIIDTGAMSPPAISGGLWEKRAAAYNICDAPDAPKCSIVVTAYNRLNKTRYCVECILKYTQDVDYELILIDNGSSDGTYEFFQSVPYSKKQIIKVTKNIGAAYPGRYVSKIFRGKYFVSIPNDVYVTKNWLSNLLKCYESDPSIGYIEPVSSNVSNLQEVDLEFSDFSEMQEKAAAYNKSDPLKWEERMRLISIITILSREVIDVIGAYDAAYFHDFTEDDSCIRLRRSGYKLILCCDTWICHDHNFRANEDKDPEAFKTSLESGRSIYLEKYYGIDPWMDIVNNENYFIRLLDSAPLPSGKAKVLTVDIRCGMPVLEIRNLLRRRGVKEVQSYAFTTDAKYFHDLQTVCAGVECDRIDYIQDYYGNDEFDIVAVFEAVNRYADPIALLRKLYTLVKPGGMLLVKIRNTNDYGSLYRAAGIDYSSDSDFYVSVSHEDVRLYLHSLGARDCDVLRESKNISYEAAHILRDQLKAANNNAKQETLNQLYTTYHCIKAVKGEKLVERED